MRRGTQALIIILCAAALLFVRHSDGTSAQPNWRTDPAWYNGKAEWALYDAQRVIYGTPRRYNAMIFTNKQIMDPGTTTKAADPDMPGGVEVFKHNVSEMIDTENYTYRFLTTCFMRTDDLTAFKITASSQEDCGSTYRQYTAADGRITARQFGYFPSEGSAVASFAVTDDLVFHDALTLTLRDFPFESTEEGAFQELALVGDLTDNHWVKLTPGSAIIEYLGRSQITVPYGTLETFHLRVRHNEMGGETESHYWFATDPSMRRVLVQYIGPFGVKYKLKRLDWWAYWDKPKPQ